MNAAAVTVENLSVRFGNYRALEDLSLTIESGAFISILGPNGAGKSTFVKSLLGLTRPSSGTVKIFDVPAEAVDPAVIGYVPQVKTMDRSFPALSIELVMTGIRRRWPWSSSSELHRRACEALAQVGADHLSNRRLGRLSGGELQRVYLARSFVRNPKIIVLDEPATGVDAVGEADLYRLLEDYQQRSQATVILITHDWQVAAHHADKVLLLNRRQICFDAPGSTLTAENLRVAFGHIGHHHETGIVARNHE